MRLWYPSSWRPSRKTTKHVSFDISTTHCLQERKPKFWASISLLLAVCKRNNQRCNLPYPSSWPSARKRNKHVRFDIPISECMQEKKPKLWGSISLLLTVCKKGHKRCQTLISLHPNICKKSNQRCKALISLLLIVCKRKSCELPYPLLVVCRKGNKRRETLISFPLSVCKKANQRCKLRYASSWLSTRKINKVVSFDIPSPRRLQERQPKAWNFDISHPVCKKVKERCEVRYPTSWPSARKTSGSVSFDIPPPSRQQENQLKLWALISLLFTVYKKDDQRFGLR